MARMHELDRCVVTGWRIEKKDRVPLQPCPHCGTRLPVAGDTVPVDEGSDGRAKVLIVTTDDVPGFQVVETFGAVLGSKGHDLRREAKAAQEAISLVRLRAGGLGGNAIVGFRLAVSDALVYAYGTAVMIERAQNTSDTKS